MLIDGQTDLERKLCRFFLPVCPSAANELMSVMNDIVSQAMITQIGQLWIERYICKMI